MSDGLPLPTARFLSQEQAAAYVGVSVTTFVAEIKAGIWPPAFKRGAKTTGLTWDRMLLDRAADRLAGFINTTSPDAALTAAEQAALEATERGTPAPNRHQHRNAKAA